jgi:rhamnogalacturonan hydrolase
VTNKDECVTVKV